MIFGTRTIVETSDGVYQPVNLRFEMGSVAVFLLAVAVLFVFGKLPLWYALLYSSAVSIQPIRQLIRYRKLGPLGRPSVSIAGGLLYIDRPTDYRGGISHSLPDLKQLVVYGPSNQRRYRLIKTDGTWIEAIPVWKPDIDRHVIAFLQRALQERLTVEEPQTAFAVIRGEGPATLS